MKALDSPALLAILEGRKEASWILREIAGEEACTTEVNLFELEAAVLSDRRGDRARRLAALERLRRRITVLPVNDLASRAAARAIAGGRGSSGAMAALILGTLASAGATVLLTSEAARFQNADSPVPIRLIRSMGKREQMSRKV